MMNSVLGTYTPPEPQTVRRITIAGVTKTFHVRTARLPGGPNYVYTVWLRNGAGDEGPLLERITLPGNADIIDAYTAWKGKHK